MKEPITLTNGSQQHRFHASATYQVEHYEVLLPLVSPISGLGVDGKQRQIT